MLETSSRMQPSCQFVPVTKKSSPVTKAPLHASRAIRRRRDSTRSAMAPTIGSTKAEMSVDTVMT